MKKIINRSLLFLIVVLLSFAFIGCGEDPTPGPGPDDPTPSGEVKPTSISVDGIKNEIMVGESFTLNVKIQPENATNKQVRYSSSDSSVVSIKDGVVTGVSAGSAKITVTALGDNSIKKEFNVTVKSESEEKEEITSIVISGKNEVEVNSAIDLAVKIEPSTVDKSVTWSVSDESIATIINGVVRGIKEGTVVVTATSKYDPTKSAEFTITVVAQTIKVQEAPDSITITGVESVEVGYGIQLQAIVAPEGSDGSIRWESTKPEVATVDEKGFVKGVAEGTTYIVAYSKVDETVKSSRFKVKVEIDQSTLIPINDMQGYTIVFMDAASALAEHDPFLEEYVASDKFYKQRAWREVESTFNCNITVVGYPDDAPYGSGRADWLIAQAQLGKAQADFFKISSSYIPNLVAGGAIQPTTEWFAKYGKNQIDPACRYANSYKGDLYVVSHGILPDQTYPYWGLIYNYGLVQKYKLESPAKLYNEDRWDYDDFLNWCLSAQAVLPEDYYVCSGQLYSYWEQMSASSGIRLGNPANLSLNLKHPYVINAVNTLKALVKGGAFDVKHQGSDQAVEAMQAGRAIFQSSEVWFAKASNRFPADLWGEDTSFGFVPYPYDPAVGRDNVCVRQNSFFTFCMGTNREFGYPKGVTGEDVFRAMQTMFLNTAKYMSTDESFDATAAKRQTASLKFDDPESVEALISFTPDKSMFDAIGRASDGVSLNSTVKTLIANDTDYEEAMDGLEEQLYINLIAAFG